MGLTEHIPVPPPVLPSFCFPPDHLLCLTPDMSPVVSRPWSTKEPKTCSKAAITDMNGFEFPSNLSNIQILYSWLIHKGTTAAKLPSSYTLPSDMRAFASFIQTFYEFRESSTPGLLHRIFFVVISLIVSLKYLCTWKHYYVSLQYCADRGRTQVRKLHVRINRVNPKIIVRTAVQSPLDRQQTWIIDIHNRNRAGES